MNNEDYNEGFNDASEYFVDSHIPLDYLISSFDKFFDKISHTNNLLNYIYKHFKCDKDINDITMKTEEFRKKNLDKILNMVYTEINSTKKKGIMYEKRKTHKSRNLVTPKRRKQKA